MFNDNKLYPFRWTNTMNKFHTYSRYFNFTICFVYVLLLIIIIYLFILYIKLILSRICNVVRRRLMSIGNLNMQEMYRIHIVLKSIENTQGNAFIMILNRSNMCYYLHEYSWGNDMQSKIQLKSGIEAKVCFTCFIILTNIVLWKHMHYVYFRHILCFL